MEPRDGAAGDSLWSMAGHDGSLSCWLMEGPWPYQLRRQSSTQSHVWSRRVVSQPLPHQTGLLLSSAETLRSSGHVTTFLCPARAAISRALGGGESF